MSFRGLNQRCLVKAYKKEMTYPLKCALSSLSPREPFRNIDVKTRPEGLPHQVRSLSRETELSLDVDLLVIPLMDTRISETDLFTLPPELDFLNRAVIQSIRDISRQSGFTPKEGNQAMGWIPPIPNTSLRGICLVGLGKQTTQNPFDSHIDSNLDQYTKLGETCAALLDEMKAMSPLLQTLKASILMPHAASQRGVEQAMQIASLGGLYKETRFKTDKPPVSHQFDFYTTNPLNTHQTVDFQSLVDGIHLAQTLVSSPPNLCNPESMVQVSQRLVSMFPESMTLKILDESQCKEHGMGAFLGVAQGSRSSPVLLHMTYTPKKCHKKVVFVGKGITFDSGGYNIKPTGYIESMKIDMGGLAAVWGAALALGKREVEGVEVHFISAVCENMVDAHAMRPGDILTVSNGKTVEVVNTDAEGRLTLADALVYASRLNPDYIVDVATLTGAIGVGLGKEYAGLFCNTAEMSETMQKAAYVAHERVWPMPKADKKQLESKVADMKNCGEREGGAMSAALFLSEFVGGDKEVHWAHLDIAFSCVDKDTQPTGFGVRTMVALVDLLSAK